MPFPSLARLTGTPRNAPAGDPADRVAAAKAHAAKAEAAAQVANQAYEAALASSVDPDGPDVEAAHKRYKQALAALERADKAVRVAEAQHANAQAQAVQAAKSAEWDEAQRAMAAVLATGRKLAESIASTAEADKAFKAAGDALTLALPGKVKSSPLFWTLRDALGAGTRVELERTSTLPDPRHGMGLPPSKPLADVLQDLAAALKRFRDEAEAARHD